MKVNKESITTLFYSLLPGSFSLRGKEGFFPEFCQRIGEESSQFYEREKKSFTSFLVHSPSIRKCLQVGKGVLESLSFFSLKSKPDALEPKAAIKTFEEEVEALLEPQDAKEEHPLSRKENLEALSQLKEDKVLQKLTFEEYLSFDENISDAHLNKLPFWVDYFKKILDSFGQVHRFCKESTKEAFQQAIDRRSKFQKLPLQNAYLLQEQARKMEGEVHRLIEDQPWLYFGSLKSPHEHLVPSQLEEFLPEELRLFLTNDSKELSQKLVEKILTPLQEELLSLRTVKEEISKDLFENRFSKVLSQVSPRFYEAFWASLKEDAKELFFDFSNLSQHFSDELFSEFGANHFKEMLEQKLLFFLEQAKEPIQEHVQKLKLQISSQLPRSVLKGLSCFGLNYPEKKEFWIEIEKEAGKETYSLRFFADPNSPCHPTLVAGEKEGVQYPLVFRGLAKKDLNETFFSRLLLYEVRGSHYDQGVQTEYSLEDIPEDMSSWFQKPFEPADESSFLAPQIRPHSLGGFLSCYLQHYRKENDVDLDLFQYRTQMQMLIDLWMNLKEGDFSSAALRRKIELDLEKLTKLGLALYEKDRFSIERLKELYATSFEIRKTLREKEPKQENYKLSSIVPVPFQKYLKESLEQGGIGLLQIETLKEAFGSILGEEFEKVFDLILKESLPEMSQVGVSEAQEMGWTKVFGIDRAAHFVNTLPSMRVSLLHFYRIYAEISSLFVDYISVCISAQVVESILLFVLSQLGIPPVFCISSVSKLIAYFGPSIAKKLLPKEVLEGFLSFLGVYEEIIYHVKKRLLFLTLKILIPKLCSQETLQSFESQLKAIKESMSREARLSFEVPKYPLKKEEIRISEEKIDFVEGKLYQMKSLKERRLFDVMLDSPLEREFFSDSLLQDLQSIENTFDRMQQSKAFKGRELQLFLTRSLQNLPVPQREKRGIWDRCQDPLKVLEIIHRLSFRMASLPNEDGTYEELFERVFYLHILYAIADTLLRRTSFTKIPDDLVPNGSSLLEWISSRTLRLKSPEMYQKLEMLASYFQIDLTRLYTTEEKHTYRESAIFHSDKNLENFSISKIDALYRKENHLYRLLLNDPSVQERIRLLGIREEEDQVQSLITDPPLSDLREERKRELEIKNHCHFSELPQKEQDQIKDFDHEMKRTSYEGDPRVGILPREVYLARFCYFATLLPYANQMDSKTFREFWNKEGLEKGIYFQEERSVNDLENIFPMIQRGIDLAVEKMHQGTFGFFKEKTYFSKISLPKGNYWAKRVITPKERGQEFAIKATSLQDLISRLQKPDSQINYNTWLNRDVSHLSQSEIVLRDSNLPYRLEDIRLTQQEAHLLEMMDLEGEDEIVRVLSFFSEQKDLLKEEKYRYLANLFLSQPVVLTRQLRQRPLLIKEFGKWFFEMLEHYREKKEALFFIGLGETVLKYSQEVDREAASFFPKFDEVLSQFISVYQKKNIKERKDEGGKDLLIMAYAHRVSRLSQLSPRSIRNKKEKNKILKEIALLAYAQIRSNWPSWRDPVIRDSLSAIYLWYPVLKNKMSKVIGFRSEVLDQITEDAGTHLLDKNALWRGNYPIYQKEGSELGLNVEMDKDALVEDSFFKAKDLKERVLAETTLILDEEPIYQGNLCIFEKAKIWVENQKGQLNIWREIEGKSYSFAPLNGLLNPFLLESVDQSFWLEKTDREEKELLIIEQEEIKKIVTLKTKENNVYDILTEEVFHENKRVISTTLDQIDHRLSFLSSLAPLSSIKVYLKKTEEGPLLDSFSLSNEIAFQIQRDGKEEIAFDQNPKNAGFFLAKEQIHPLLKEHKESLLLQNEQGQEKIYIKEESLTELLFASFVRQSQLPSSLWLERQMNSLFSQGAIDKKKIYCYSVEDGNLISEDPWALCYLFAFSLSRNQMPEAKRAFEEIKRLAKIQAFDAGVFAFLDQLLFPFAAYLKSDEISQIFLEWAACREENRLFYQTVQKEPVSKMQALSWAFMQVQYSQYLNSENSFRLNEMQELFLLKGLAKLNERIFQEAFSKLFSEEEETTWLQSIGIRPLANTLMFCPSIAKRYWFLKARHKETNKWNQIFQGVLIDAIFSEKAPSSQFALPSLNFLKEETVTIEQKRDLLERILKIYDKTATNTPWSLDLDAAILLTNHLKGMNEPVQIDLTSLTPFYIREHFLSLYQLALGKGPLKKRVEEFEKIIKILSGKAKNPVDTLLIQCLKQVVSHRNRPFMFFPDPEKLDSLLQDSLRLQRLEMQTKKLEMDLQLLGVKKEDLFKKQELFLKSHSLHLRNQQAFLFSKENRIRSTSSREDLLEKIWTRLEISQLPQTKTLVFPESAREKVEELLKIESEVEAIAKKHSIQLDSRIEKYDEKISKLYQDFLGKWIQNFNQMFLKVKSLSACSSIQPLSLCQDILSQKTIELVKETAVLQGIAGRILGPAVPAALQATKTVLNTVQYIRKINSQILSVEEMEPPSIKEPSVLPDMILDPLLQREGMMQKMMKRLYDQYFSHSFIEKAEDKKAENYLSHEADDSGVRKGFTKINQSLEEFYERPRLLQAEHTLLEGKEIFSLQEDLQDLEKAIRTRLEKERRFIEKYARISFEKPSDETFLKEALQAKVEMPPSFEEIEKAFVQGDDTLFQKRTKMREEDLLEMKKRLYLYYSMHSFSNFFFSQVKKVDLNKATGVQKLADLLMQKRAYSFEGLSKDLIRANLVFESRSGWLLWDRQFAQMKRLFSDLSSSKVIELIMGSGKTAYGLPLGDYILAKRGKLPINIWPSPVAKTNIRDISKKGPKIFDQGVNALEISRSFSWQEDQAWALEKKVQRALLDEEQLNMTKPSIQALELCFLEKAFEEKPDFASLEPMKRTLKQIREQASAQVDEVHVALRQKDELNYPLGRKKRLKSSFASVMIQIIHTLVSSEEFFPFLSVRSQKPFALPKEIFKEKIQNPLALKMARHFLENGSEEEVQLWADYLSGKAEEIPEAIIKHQRRSEIALAKGMITLLLPNVLEKTAHVDFNLSKAGAEEFAKPSEGNDNPIESSMIRSPFEAFLKTAFLLLHDRLKTGQLDKFVSWLKEKAELEAKKEVKSLEKTSPAEFFKQICPDYDLFAFNDADKPFVYAILNRSDFVVLFYLKHFITEQIEYFEENLSSNASNFASMFNEVLGYTGTPFNQGSYPEKTKVLSDPGTDGESIDLIELEGKSKIELLLEENPMRALDEILTRFFEGNKDVRALIDRGAVLNGLASDKVARRILEYVIQKREDIDGVAFYLKGQLVILERGAVAPIPIDQSHISPERRLSYFPQPQTYAADIPQIDGAVGVVTLSEDTCANELFQAVWRMRGLKKQGQSLLFAIPKKLKENILKANHKEGQEGISPRDLIAFTSRNEAQKQAYENYLADRQKMENALRRAILDEVLSKDRILGLLPFQEAP